MLGLNYYLKLLGYDKVNVENSEVLRLVVDDALNGLSNDYADWADACLIREDGSIVYLSNLPDDRKMGTAIDWGKVKLKEIADASQTENVVSLVYIVPGQKPVPRRFNYLADLVYSLIEKRPILNSWIKIEQKSH